MACSLHGNNVSVATHAENSALIERGSGIHPSWSNQHGTRGGAPAAAEPGGEGTSRRTRFEGSDAGGRGCSSVPGNLSRSGREDRALLAVHTRVDEPGAASWYALN